MEFVLEDGSVVSDVDKVLAKWKHDFCSLFKSADSNATDNQTDREVHGHSAEPLFTDNISIHEVRNAIVNAKRGKACGLDGIPSDVLCNDASISYLHVFLMFVLIKV